jgi:NADPH:quinone reductase-like Zn-dependent oxidoreductase
MKAVIQPRYGPLDVLELRDDADPPPGGGDATVVRVRAASVNAGDWRAVQAKPFVVRLANGLRKPRRGGVGVDFAGEVVWAGAASARGLGPGDEIFGMTSSGALAEYATADWWALKPAALSFEEAAAVPVAGVTALQAVRDQGRLRPGQTVLVHGAGGGVGTFAVQLARAFGGEVTAASRPAQAELLRSLGAVDVLDHTREDVAAGTRRYDLIVDVGGGASISTLRRALAPRGTLVLVGAGKRLGGPVGRLAAGTVRSRLLRQRVKPFIAGRAGFEENLATLARMIRAGDVRPVIDTVYPLERTVDALAHLAEGRARGKVVVTV